MPARGELGRRAVLEDVRSRLRQQMLVNGEDAVLALERDRLECPVVRAHERHAAVGQPVGRIPAGPRLDLLVLVDVLVPQRAPAGVQQDHVTGADLHVLLLARGLEVLRRDDEPALQHVLPKQLRDVQADAATDPGTHGLGTELRQSLRRVEVLVMVAVVEVPVDPDVPEAVDMAPDVVGAGDLLLEIRQVAAARSEACRLERAVAEHDLLPGTGRERGNVLGQQLRELDGLAAARELERFQRPLRRQLVARAELIVGAIARGPPLRTLSPSAVVGGSGARLGLCHAYSSAGWLITDVPGASAAYTTLVPALTVGSNRPVPPPNGTVLVANGAEVPAVSGSADRTLSLGPRESASSP